MKIAMIGTGYVGLTTATCLAMLGHEVRCHDRDPHRLAAISAGDLPIYEPGLDQEFAAVRKSGRLRTSQTARECVTDAELVFLAVGTPPMPDGSVDLAQVEQAAREVSIHMASGSVLVVKSTVTVGTCRRLRQIVARKRGRPDVSIASNPEFLREGSAIADFLKPDRIVIGADDEGALGRLRAAYRHIEEAGAPMLLTSTENAELVKHAANSFLALKIGFINDVADLCERAGADVGIVAEGIGLDRRIGRSFLAAGPGFGGSCFPKDTRAFAAAARQLGTPQPMIELLIERNDRRQERLARWIGRETRGSGGTMIAALGLAFKSGTDDTRESPAVRILEVLLGEGLEMRCHDPYARLPCDGPLSAAGMFACPYEAARGADAVVILTEWNEYRELDLRRLRTLMSGSKLFDLRNLVEPEAATEAGFNYFGIGRGTRRGAAVASVERLAAAE